MVGALFRVLDDLAGAIFHFLADLVLFAAQHWPETVGLVACVAVMWLIVVKARDW